MRYYFRIAVAAAMLFGIVASTQPASAQVYSLYKELTLECGTPYRSLEAFTELNAADFALPPNFTPSNRDDGYFKFPVQLPFEFEYNDEVFDRLWVNVNGFIAFTATGTLPPFVAPDVNDALFIKSTSYPNNVVAPFWGDHYYRTVQDRFNNFIPSSIRVGWEYYDGPYRVFIIEWKDLNINDDTVQTSVATFQVRLYESKDPFSRQGDIEFAYGRTGSPDLDPSLGNLVIIRGATVGIKGESSGITGDDADFLNGLLYDQEPFDQRTLRTKTSQWPPSEGATDCRIRFSAVITKKIEEWWGDGDANLSKAIGNKHHTLDQNRFVTVEDARVIMHSVVTGKPLDSVRRREAYHGDVTHNGRFYYDNLGEKRYIPWRSREYYQDLPIEVNTVKRIYYQVTEYDASMILHYIAGRVPELPWIYDTTINKGKLGADEAIATGIRFGTANKLATGDFRLPVYLNGYINGPVAFKMNIDAEIIDASGVGITAMNHNNTVVASGAGDFDASQPICYVTIKTDKPVLNITGLRFNDNELGSFKAGVTETSEVTNEVLAQNSPNPVTSTTLIALNLPSEANYELAIYDAIGNRIKTIANGSLNAGPHSFVWDGTDESGKAVNSGVYVYRLTGNNVTESKKLVLSK